MSVLKIELLSDLCASSGEIYNATIDTDICYDKYGLPFIPAKRIKGCLRESALELNDWNMEIPIETIFGEPKKQQTKLQLSNAKLEGYDEIVKALENETNLMLKHPQNVLNQYTMLRSQTRIESETGIADDTSLRTIRVLKKGLIFLAEFKINCMANDDNEKFEQCCQNFRSMGTNCTRGMGEIKVSVDWKGGFKSQYKIENKKWPEEISENRKRSNKKGKQQQNKKKKQYDILDYTIYFESPVLFRSVDGGQLKTQHYIEGSKILGYIAQHCENSFLEFMNQGELKCSYAYPSNAHQRYLPAPASLYTEKDQSKELRDKLANNIKGENEQLIPLGDTYINSNSDNIIKIMTVDTEIHYHHSRPLDKGIGHVKLNSKESQLYQIQSMSEGQMFSGKITGSPDQIEKVYDIIKKNSRFRMGFNRSAEYGAVSISIDNLRNTVKKPRPKSMNQFVLKLESPIILYNENGMYSTDINDLKKEVEEVLSKENKLEIVKSFIKYISVGGYNVTWNLRKPTLICLDKGTVLLMKTTDNSKVDITQLESQWFGERVNEGFGEVSVYALPEKYYKTLKVLNEENVQINKTKQVNFEKRIELLEDIAKVQVRKNIETMGRKNAEKMEKILREDFAKPVVNVLTLLLKECKSYEEYQTSYTQRYKENSAEKQKKYQLATKISEVPFNSFSEEMKKFKIENMNNDSTKKWYLSAFLNQAKFIQRGNGK